jgi:ABC-type transporter Mla subunit MlaD
MRRRRGKRHAPRLTLFQAGLLGIVIILVLSYGAYTKFANPFASTYEVHVLFPSANGLLPGSFVRIAGVNVGTVKSVSTAPGCRSAKPTGCQAADVTLAIQSNGEPIHTNATFWIRPRIFLEGNFFVDLYPGTPEAPIANSGHTFPLTSGIEPVQFDQVLGALPSYTRGNLQTLLSEYGKAVDVSGTSYNRSVRYWLPAYKYTAVVTHDALGIQPNDLSTWIDKGGTANAAFDAHPQDLENLITDFNTTAGAFARENTALANAVGELPNTLAAATPALNSLNAAFPPLNRIATALIPGVRSTGPTVDASLPFIRQLRYLVRPAELRGLVHDLAGTVPSLANLSVKTVPLMENAVRPAASCVVNVIYPWSRLTINDGTFSGTQGFPLRPVYVEAVDYLPGLAGESRDFDANGPYIRVLGEGGSLTYSLQPGMFGQSLQKISGVQPAIPASGQRPPLNETAPCETQTPYNQQTIQSPVSAPPAQIGTGVSTPAAAARWKSVVQVAIGQLRQIVGNQGLKLNVPASVKALLK